MRPPADVVLALTALVIAATVAWWAVSALLSPQAADLVIDGWAGPAPMAPDDPYRATDDTYREEGMER